MSLFLYLFWLSPHSFLTAARWACGSKPIASFPPLEFGGLKGPHTSPKIEDVDMNMDMDMEIDIDIHIHICIYIDIWIVSIYPYLDTISMYP